MRIFIFVLILFFAFHINVFASENLNSTYETNYLNIDIESLNVSEEKIIEIDKIKFLSLYEILNKILNKKNLNKFKKEINLNKEINYLIKNLNIENEFISINRYSAKIKVNFYKEQIINLLRNYKINYSDISLHNLLLLSYISNDITEEGLSKNNVFYKKFFVEKSGLLNFSYPVLSPNDRFILPYNKLENINLNNLYKISQKYNSNYVIILGIDENQINNDFELSIYSSINNEIIDSYNFRIKKDLSYNNNIISIIDEWWKNLIIVDNSKINRQICRIKNDNIHELYFIISKLNSISQIKSLQLVSIDYGKYLYELIYYGDTSILSLNLSNNKILNNNLSNNKCLLLLDI